MQVPCAPAFAITHYRSQGRTFENVIVDLETTRQSGHQNFAAIYVMLSRVKSMAGLTFLRWFRNDILRVKPGKSQWTNY
jgi:ATP-dependent exoDNAse (exonuclease V) alpha subunit